MNEFYINAGARIRKIRERNHYTREEFGEIVDLSPKFLYEIETGHKGFSADSLYRIAKGLSVSCEYIVSGNNEKSNQKTCESLEMFNESQLKTINSLLGLIHELGCQNN